MGGLVVLVLVARGHVPAAAVLAVLVISLGVARAVSPRADRAVASLLRTVGHAVGVALSLLLLGLFMVVVLFPVWLVTRALRWDALDADGVGGRWQTRRTARWLSHPDRPFGDDRLRLSTRSRGRAIAVVLVPMAFLLLVAFPFRGPTERMIGQLVPGSWLPGGDEVAQVTVAEAPVDRSLPSVQGPVGDGPDGIRSIRVAHEGLDWAAAYFEEQYPLNYTFDGFLTVRMSDTSGEVVNVVDRERRSYAVEADDPLEVWFLGSSAMFGLGQRDEHTIPSEVTRLAEDAGIAVRARNFGVPSYRGWQDAVLLAQLLSERPRPDLIVAYEGYNDVMAYLPPGSPTQATPQFTESIRGALINEGAVFGGPTQSAQDPIPRTEAWSPQNVADVFGRGAELERALAAAHDTPIVQYLQPSVWTRDLAADDATLANIGADRAYHRSFGSIWNQARAGMAVDGVIDLGDVLDDADEVLYSDDVHTNEVGARLVAEAMFADLRPHLERLAVASG